jgi:hypothetical protein
VVAHDGDGNGAMRRPIDLEMKSIDCGSWRFSARVDGPAADFTQRLGKCRDRVLVGTRHCYVLKKAFIGKDTTIPTIQTQALRMRASHADAAMVCS